MIEIVGERKPCHEELGPWPKTWGRPMALLTYYEHKTKTQTVTLDSMKSNFRGGDPIFENCPEGVSCRQLRIAPFPMVPSLCQII
jgi:hypothetical protein